MAATPDLRPTWRASTQTSAITGYYADSMASPGIWMGRGLTGVRMDGLVDPEHLHRVLVGQNPHTGDQLVTANGSAQRAHPRRRGRRAARARRRTAHPRPGRRCPRRQLLVPAARAKATTRARAVQARQEAEGQELTPLPPSHLDATRAIKGSAWQVTRAEARRFAAERRSTACRRRLRPHLLGPEVGQHPVGHGHAGPAGGHRGGSDRLRARRHGLPRSPRRPRPGLGPQPRAARATTSNARTPPGWWPPPTCTTPRVPSIPNCTSTSWWPTWPRAPTARSGRWTVGRCSCTPRPPATWPAPNFVTAWPWSSGWPGNRCTGAWPTSTA